MEIPCKGCQQTCYSCQEACQQGLTQQPLEAGKHAACAGVSHNQVGLQGDAPSPWRERGHGRAFCGACPQGYHAPCVCPASLPIHQQQHMGDASTQQALVSPPSVLLLADMLRRHRPVFWTEKFRCKLVDIRPSCRAVHRHGNSTTKCSAEFVGVSVVPFTHVSSNACDF